MAEGARLPRIVGLCILSLFAAKVSALVAAGRACVPLLDDRLVRLALFFGTKSEPWALRQAYALAPRASFSRSVLEAGSVPLAVAEVRSLTWGDLGTPIRVARTLRMLGIPAAWLAR